MFKLIFLVMYLLVGYWFERYTAGDFGRYFKRDPWIIVFWPVSMVLWFYYEVKYQMQERRYKRRSKKTRK